LRRDLDSLAARLRNPERLQPSGEEGGKSQEHEGRDRNDDHHLDQREPRLARRKGGLVHYECSSAYGLENL